MVPRVLKSTSAWRRIVTVLCLVGVLSPAAVGAAADPEAELDAVQQRLRDANANLDDVEKRKAVELSDLSRLDDRRAELDAQLAQLNDRLGVAEAELADSTAELDATTQRVMAVQAKLDGTREQLATDRKQFASRARATYMYGGQSQWAGIVLGVDSIAEFERGVKYARSVLQSDREQVERIAALERTVQRTSTDLAALQDRQAAQREIDAERRDVAAGIVAEREQVLADVEAQVQQRRLVVAQLESDRQSYVAMVDGLQADSNSLREELAAIAAAQRAAAAEAAARAAEEAQRLAAAQTREADPVPSVPAPEATGDLLWPADGPQTSSYGYRVHPIFGTSRFHAGIDIGAPYGSPIRAADSGTVVQATVMSGYGNTVVIDHGSGMATLYAHQSSLAVSAGQSVSRGQTIGYVGSTGYSTGPHLHFEVRINGEPRDPEQYL